MLYLKRLTDQDVRRSMGLAKDAITDFFKVSTTPTIIKIQLLGDVNLINTTISKAKRNGNRPPEYIIDKKFLNKYDKKINDILIFKKNGKDKYLCEYISVSNTKHIIYNGLFKTNTNSELVITDEGCLDDINRNVIFYGPPGTGKSFRLNSYANCANIVYETTFHPEYEYSDFIGQYRPETISCSKRKSNPCDNKVIYKFQAGVFLKALKCAFQNIDSPILLRIEEINRGNTAAIFGDLFQLLDRDHTGTSSYGINMSKDIMNYFGKEEDEKIKIPKNFYIFATMNTSDQSLFPMDSAFKRRWEWKYIPIDYEDADRFKIQVGQSVFSWKEFIKVVNDGIIELTDSEDKQLGNRFVNPSNEIISCDEFTGKVLFYLWTDIFRHEDHNDDRNIFKVLIDEKYTKDNKIRFSNLFNSKGDIEEDIVTDFLKNLGLDEIVD